MPDLTGTSKREESKPKQSVFGPVEGHAAIKLGGPDDGKVRLPQAGLSVEEDKPKKKVGLFGAGGSDALLGKGGNDTLQPNPRPAGKSLLTGATVPKQGKPPARGKANMTPTLRVPPAARLETSIDGNYTTLHIDGQEPFIFETRVDVVPSAKPGAGGTFTTKDVEVDERERTRVFGPKGLLSTSRIPYYRRLTTHQGWKGR